MSSYGRTKVLTIMLETGELNISEVTRRSKLSHSATARHLEFLTKSGILTEKRFNRIRIFRVDQASPLARGADEVLLRLEGGERSRLPRGLQLAP